MRTLLTSPVFRVVRPAAIACLACFLASCASVEKRVNLTYQTAVFGAKGAGEVYLAKPVLQQRLPGLPGGRVVLGSVEGTGTQLVTADDLPLWAGDALARELESAGYDVKKVDTLPVGVPAGIVLRISRLSAVQTVEEPVFTTTTAIGLSADVWLSGRLAKTLTASARRQDQGLDRSGDFVADSLRKTLQAVMEELVPGIAKSLPRPR